MKIPKADTIYVNQANNQIINQKNDNTARINKGNTYINKDIEAIIGLHDINVLDEATINITLGIKPATKEEVTAGKSFKYTTKGENKTLVIKTVNYVRGYVEVEII